MERVDGVLKYQDLLLAVLLEVTLFSTMRIRAFYTTLRIFHWIRGESEEFCTVFVFIFVRFTETQIQKPLYNQDPSIKMPFYNQNSVLSVKCIKKNRCK